MGPLKDQHLVSKFSIVTSFTSYAILMSIFILKWFRNEPMFIIMTGNIENETNYLSKADVSVDPQWTKVMSKMV